MRRGQLGALCRQGFAPVCCATQQEIWVDVDRMPDHVIRTKCKAGLTYQRLELRQLNQSPRACASAMILLAFSWIWGMPLRTKSPLPCFGTIIYLRPSTA
jgi:hypothetical protein